MVESWRWRNTLVCLIGSVLGVVGHPSLAQSYDDPAIAICELVALHEEMQNPSYKRISADVNGDTASIIYELAILNLAPNTQIVECRYRLVEQKFQIDFALTPDEKTCTDPSDGGRSLVQHLDLGADAGIIAGLMCQPHFDEVQTRERAAEPLLAPVRSAGVYPISPKNTALVTKPGAEAR